uniref:Uncharacterized protein n=1 Tax=Rhinopithecus bieti TaxID=61621 RepID=A0A2K6KAN4_RHIBE
MARDSHSEIRLWEVFWESSPFQLMRKREYFGSVPEMVSGISSLALILLSPCEEVPSAMIRSFLRTPQPC